MLPLRVFAFCLGGDASLSRRNCDFGTTCGTQPTASYEEKTWRVPPTLYSRNGLGLSLAPLTFVLPPCSPKKHDVTMNQQQSYSIVFFLFVLLLVGANLSTTLRFDRLPVFPLSSTVAPNHDSTINHQDPRTSSGILQRGGETNTNITTLETSGLSHSTTGESIAGNGNLTLLPSPERADGESSDCYFADDNTTPLPEVPSFLIAGAQKAGTSAVYYLLEQLPGLKPSITFEAHFFDQRGELGKNASALSPDDVCKAREKYLAFFEGNGSFTGEDNPISFEKTPAYLCKPAVPALIRKVTPWVKIIVMLRNPVDRAYSAYKMIRQRAKNETEVPSFEDLVRQDLRALRAKGLSIAPSMRKYALNQTTSDDFAIPPAQSQSYNTLPALLMRMLPRGMYALQLVNWIEHFSLGSTLKVVQYESFVQNRSRVLNEILDFVGARPHHLPANVLADAYGPTRGIKREVNETLSPNTRSYLEQFYKPYNAKLADLLGKEWRDVWNT